MLLMPVQISRCPQTYQLRLQLTLWFSSGLQPCLSSLAEPKHEASHPQYMQTGHA